MKKKHLLWILTDETGIIRVKKRRNQSRSASQGDFPGGPVAKTPGSQCRAPRFDPWSGNGRSHMLQLRESPAVTKILPAAMKTKDPKCQTKT